MRLADQPVRKIGIIMPASLLAYVDAQARKLGQSRSEWIRQVLTQLQAAEEEHLAAEGYRFYSQESAAFAEASLNATDQAIRAGSETE